MRVLVVFICGLLIISGGVSGMYDPRIVDYASVTPNPKAWIKDRPNKARLSSLEVRVADLEKRLKNAGIK